MRLTWRILPALLIVLLLFTPGCSRKPTGKIVVQAPVAPASAPLLLMQEEGLLAGRGIEMDLILYKSVEEATTRVLKGEADFTILPVNVAAKLYNKDVPVSLANVSTWGLLYLVTDDPEIKKIADLRGREIYVGARGATPDVLTRYILSKNGVPESGMDIRYGQSPEIARMLMAGLARTAVLPEPMVTQALAQRPQLRIVADFYREWQLVEGEGAGLPQAGMVVKNDYISKNPGAYDSFQEMYRKKTDEVVADPGKAAPLVEKHLGIPGRVFSSSMERTRLRFVDGGSARKDVVSYLSRLNEFSPEMVGGKVPDDRFFVQR
ncbi:MAG: ABC transporter substrate-binding protein [Desulfocucumaceae bacterium]